MGVQISYPRTDGERRVERDINNLSNYISDLLSSEVWSIHDIGSLLNLINKIGWNNLPPELKRLLLNYLYGFRTATAIDSSLDEQYSESNIEIYRQFEHTVVQYSEEVKESVSKLNEPEELFRAANIDRTIGQFIPDNFGDKIKGLFGSNDSNSPKNISPLIENKFDGDVITNDTIGVPSGHCLARSVTDGGGNNTLAGHGSYDNGVEGVQERIADFILPEGTALTVPNHGIGLPDIAGKLMEKGDWESVGKLMNNSKEFEKRLSGMTTYLPGSSVKDYILSDPKGLNIMSGSVSVTKSTNLSTIIAPNQGCVTWAGCTVDVFTPWE
jgi:hypothetical protein